jgi:hypothetical protein
MKESSMRKISLLGAGLIEKGVSPVETFYAGYVANAIMDACCRMGRRALSSQTSVPVKLSKSIGRINPLEPMLISQSYPKGGDKRDHPLVDFNHR